MQDIGLIAVEIFGDGPNLQENCCTWVVELQGRALPCVSDRQPGYLLRHVVMAWALRRGVVDGVCRWLAVGNSIDKHIIVYVLWIGCQL